LRHHGPVFSSPVHPATPQAPGPQGSGAKLLLGPLSPTPARPPRAFLVPCVGRLKVIAFIADDAVAKRILLHLGLDSRGPPVARAQAPPDFSDPGPRYDGVDPVYAD